MTTMRVVGECFFWYRLTRVFPDKFHRAVKRLCVCVCTPVVERLLSTAALMLTKGRNKLQKVVLSQLLMIKINKELETGD